MAKKKKKKRSILAIDDDPDILDVIRLTLEDEYDVETANNGEAGVEEVYRHAPDLILVDYMMPKMTGIEVVERLKGDVMMRHLPIIMVTGKGEVGDKVEGLEAGADDYIVKPFEPEELTARVEMILRRTELDLDANPLTRLPGNVSIMAESERRLSANEPIAVCYADLDKFKAYNDFYGFERGDRIIRQTARFLNQATEEEGNPGDFVGHIGGDDFVVITTPDRADAISARAIQLFDRAAPDWYEDIDRERGYIVSENRQGKREHILVMTLSIGIVSSDDRELQHPAEIGEIAAELKHYAKSLEGSNFVHDRRQSDSTPSAE